jgi:hypothetical protein
LELHPIQVNIIIIVILIIACTSTKNRWFLHGGAIATALDGRSVERGTDANPIPALILSFFFLVLSRRSKVRVVEDGVFHERRHTSVKLKAQAVLLRFVVFVLHYLLLLLSLFCEQRPSVPKTFPSRMTLLFCSCIAVAEEVAGPLSVHAEYDRDFAHSCNATVNANLGTNNGSCRQEVIQSDKNHRARPTTRLPPALETSMSPSCLYSLIAILLVRRMMKRCSSRRRCTAVCSQKS